METRNAERPVEDVVGDGVREYYVSVWFVSLLMYIWYK